MYKHTNEQILSCSRYRRRAKGTGLGGLRIGSIALSALLAGIMIGFAVAPRRSVVYARSAEAAPVSTAEAPSAFASALPSVMPLVPDPDTTPESTLDPCPTVDHVFVPAVTASPADEHPDYGEVDLASSRISVCIDGAAVEMELEEYLVGVVAAEMPASSRLAALEAQAVAARTFTALRMQGKAKCKSGCTVCNNVHCCQAYRSDAELRSAWGKKYDANIEKIRDAVSGTAGIVVTFDGKLISALYHASSGPYTENSEEVFAVALPYLVSVDSCEGDAEMITVQEFTLEETIEKLNRLYPDAQMTYPPDPLDFDVWGTTDAGRVQLIRIGGTVITGAAMRKVLGLKSTRFTVEIKGEKIIFTCLGYGHGVGMSQTGANEMAKDGSDFAEILAHFYTGTELAMLCFAEN